MANELNISGNIYMKNEYLESKLITFKRIRGTIKENLRTTFYNIQIKILKITRILFRIGQKSGQ